MSRGRHLRALFVAAALSALAAAEAHAQDAGADPAAGDGMETGSIMVVMTAALPNWGQVFPALIRPDADAAGRAALCPAGPERELGPEWAATCLGKPMDAPLRKTEDGGWAFAMPEAALITGIDRVNQALFAHGYVSSGLLLESSDDGIARLRMVIGRIGSGEEPCKQARTLTGKHALGRYAGQRLFEGCTAARAFNLYVLERNFRRLADDRGPWIDHVNMELAPVSGSPGIVTLRPTGERLFGRKPWIEAVMGTANNRTPSIGSVRSFAGVAVHGPIPGVSLGLDGGITDGAVDGSASIAAEIGPRWTLRVSGDMSEAEIVDPVLRPLDIRSRGHGGDVTLGWGAVRCPLTPVYGDPYDHRRRRAFDGDGPLPCRLGARFAGDAPLGWSAARDVSVALTLSHRVSRSYLLGMPFSFAPGAVDGRSFTTVLRGSVDMLQRGRADARGERGWTLAARIELSRGLDGSATDLAGIAAPSPHFWLVRAQASYARQLPLRDTTLTLRLSGQWTRELLYTAERLPIGGANSVRGYPEATLLVDRGAVGSVEVGRLFTLTRNAGARGLSGFDPLRFRVWGFADGAYAGNLNPAMRGTDWLGSAGLGLGWKPHDAIDVSFERGWRLTDRMVVPGNSLAARGYHFGITLRPLSFFPQLFRRAGS